MWLNREPRVTVFTRRRAVALGATARCAAVIAARTSRLADRPGHVRRRLCPGRQQRHQRARTGAADVADRRPADRRGQQGRRQRQPRPARRRQRQAGRLHAVLHLGTDHRGQSVGPEGHDRHAGDARADLPDDGLSVCAGREPEGAGQQAAELVALAKKDPEKLTYSSAGVGSGNHLSGALFADAAGIAAHARALQGHRPGAGRRDQRHRSP